MTRTWKQVAVLTRVASATLTHTRCQEEKEEKKLNGCGSENEGLGSGLCDQRHSVAACGPVWWQELQPGPPASPLLCSRGGGLGPKWSQGALSLSEGPGQTPWEGWKDGGAVAGSGSRVPPRGPL